MWIVVWTDRMGGGRWRVSQSESVVRQVVQYLSEQGLSWRAFLGREVVPCELRPELKSTP